MTQKARTITVVLVSALLFALATSCAVLAGDRPTVEVEERVRDRVELALDIADRSEVLPVVDRALDAWFAESADLSMEAFEDAVREGLIEAGEDAEGADEIARLARAAFEDALLLLALAERPDA